MAIQNNQQRSVNWLCGGLLAAASLLVPAWAGSAQAAGGVSQTQATSFGTLGMSKLALSPRASLSSTVQNVGQWAQLQSNTRPSIKGQALTFAGGAVPTAALLRSSVEEAKVTAQAEAPKKDKSRSSKRPDHQHGVGAGFTISGIPHKLFSTALARYTTASCSKELKPQHREDGVLRTAGCNWGIDLQYVYRHTKHFDIAVDFGYRKLELPDGYWLTNEDWGPGCNIHGSSEDCDLGDAHYMEIDLDHLALGVDFIGRATVLNLPQFELQIGGGGGLRTLFFIGEGIYKTPLGMRPSAQGGGSGNFDGRFPGSPSGRGCYTADHLEDFTRCTPHWVDIDSVDQDGDGFTDKDEPIPDEMTKGEGLFAKCDANGCDEADLKAMGTRQRARVPKVIPLVRLLVSIRMIAAKHYGLVLDGGWDSGFFFRSSLQYHF